MTVSLELLMVVGTGVVPAGPAVDSGGATVGPKAVVIAGNVVGGVVGGGAEGFGEVVVAGGVLGGAPGASKAASMTCKGASDPVLSDSRVLAKPVVPWCCHSYGHQKISLPMLLGVDCKLGALLLVLASWHRTAHIALT